MQGKRQWSGDRLGRVLKDVSDSAAMAQMWHRLLISFPESWKEKTPTLDKEAAISSVFTFVRGLMIQRLTVEWAEVFRPKKVLK